MLHLLSRSHCSCNTQLEDQQQTIGEIDPIMGLAKTFVTLAIGDLCPIVSVLPEKNFELPWAGILARYEV